MRRKTQWIAAAAAIACLAVTLPSAANAGGGGGGKAPIPAPKGQVFTEGTYKVKAKDAPAGTPDDEITITHGPVSQIGELTASFGKGLHFVPKVRPKLLTAGCNTFTVKASWNSYLWSKMQQVWCYDGTWVTYWPSATCWGDESYPTYQYLGCSTSQQYGLWWNQGRVTYDADMCPYWVPAWGVCIDHYRIHRNYYFSAYGSAWQI